MRDGKLCRMAADETQEANTSAANTSAVFVDGAGTIREMTIHREPPYFLFPRHTPVAIKPTDHTDIPSSFQTAEFMRLGKLPDNKVVYGQSVAHLSLWGFKVSYRPAGEPAYGLNVLADGTTERVQLHEDLARYAVEQDFNRFAASAGQPFRVLFERASADPGGLITLERMGVGRKRETPTGESPVKRT